MADLEIKLPNQKAVSELRNRFQKRKEDRQKKENELSKIWKKKTPSKKIAKKVQDLPDIEA